ncbi:MAG: hypothetical protein M3R29_01040 [Verrucomicrobiota bacterium]|nr:hypothetical protein [Verrucomicrobiota bacterium]
MKLSIQKVPATFLLAAFATLTIPLLVAADAHIDVSRIIDKTAAESVLGETVKTPTPRNVEGKDGYYSKCTYYTGTPGKSLVLRVYQAASGFNPYKELEQLIETSGSMRAISGLGDKARMSSGVESGLPAHVIMLYVIKGNALVTIGLGGLEDEAATQEKVKDVAQKILAEL